MATWNEITSTLKKGVDFVRNKSEELVITTRLHNELSALKKEHTQKLTALGAKVYQFIQEDNLENADFSAEVADISELEKKVAEKQEEIEQVRQNSPEKASEEKPEIEVVEPEDCGHEIPENASFCPVCGRRV